MSVILPAAGVRFQADAEVLIIGAGACGLVAALAARQSGSDVLVLERDNSPSGSTALSSGFIPAAPTRFQTAQGIEDSSSLLAHDIQHKAQGQAVQSIVEAVAAASGPTIEWLADTHGLEWVVLDDFIYPGHSRHRMHAVPERTGTALMTRLLSAVERTGTPIATNAHVTALYTDGDEVKGVAVARPDGSKEHIGCRRLILACNGYGGNADMVAKHIPEMSDALYFGHDGNQGDAVNWGQALGAAPHHLSGYQGHGSVAHPHGVLITWALMMEGGIQVNRSGKRFSNEHEGYSEQAVHVLDQPDGIAWNIYDTRLHKLGLDFDDYRGASDMGAVITAGDVAELALATGLPAEQLATTLGGINDMAAGNQPDPFGRDFTSKPAVTPPYCAIKVTGALFHTQGGLLIDKTARVLRTDGTGLPNLYAGGGAACGVSGPECSGYLSGNGLLTAVALGRIAGENAAVTGRQAP
ncbi:MAG: FAD-dependent oxidoreductase [Hyphomicrobiales bacterium]|nr:FAD-dependent oxidoreductase [Hyphomicrobiales bacterium]